MEIKYTRPKSYKQVCKNDYNVALNNSMNNYNSKNKNRFAGSVTKTAISLYM